MAQADNLRLLVKEISARLCRWMCGKASP